MARPQLPPDRVGRQRVVVENVQPSVDGGRFPVKRVLDEPLVVEADVFGDGHDHLQAAVRFRHHRQRVATEVPMVPLGNDRWQAEVVPGKLGRHLLTVVGWVDRFGTWRADTRTKVAAGLDVSVELLMGADLLAEAAGRAPARLAARLRAHAEALRRGDGKAVLEDPLLERAMRSLADRDHETVSEPELPIDVDRPRARFSTWYEMFPRSASPEPGRHGTFADVERLLPYVAGMGFDVLYLPPIHPIGTTHRKGRNNALVPEPDDVGSPWAIGSPDGGHKAVHPDLGTLEDFRRLVARAGDHGVEIALDVAFQCSPDHPYVREHPEWFRRRPDGSVQFAENPPKRYEDIFPFDFESDAWPSLWCELHSVFCFWIEQGVRIFRVDNPHTKAFPFWEWAIPDLRRRHPDVIFLAEAFTRPRVMERLAKLGFNQSYTYFAWRNTAWELRQYFEELTRTELVEHLRPNVWPNTPDILTEYLQHGGRPAFTIRAILAATLSASYGIYGPAFELAEHVPREPGSEEYLDSEKYEVRHRDLDHPDSLRPLLTRLNRVRHGSPALQSNRHLRFHGTDNEQILCYSKRDPLTRDAVVCVVSVDPYHTQSGWVSLDLGALGLGTGEPFDMEDLLGGETYRWQGPSNFVRLDPFVLPGHVFRVVIPPPPGAVVPPAEAGTEPRPEGATAEPAPAVPPARDAGPAAVGEVGPRPDRSRPAPTAEKEARGVEGDARTGERPAAAGPGETPARGPAQEAQEGRREVPGRPAYEGRAHQARVPPPPVARPGPETPRRGRGPAGGPDRPAEARGARPSPAGLGLARPPERRPWEEGSG